MRLVRSRKGDLQYMLSRLMDIIWSIIIVVVILVIALTLWRAFYGTDKAALNQYKVFGDLLEGVIESDKTGLASAREFSLTLDLSDPMDARDSYKGTVLAQSSTGKFSTPIPPTIWYADVDDEDHITTAELNAAVEAMDAYPKQVQRYCEDSACLCFSRTILNVEEQIAKAFSNIVECKQFALPDGKDAIVFDFEGLQPGGTNEGLFGWKDPFYDYEGEKIPVIHLAKGACDKAGETYGTTFDDESTICVYAAVKPVATS